MIQQQWELNTEADTIAFGVRLASAMSDSGGVLYLQGDLGAGKTTLSRGLIQSLGHSGAVKSPTYTLVEPYELVRGPLYHFDLYRLADPEELELIGIRDYFEPGALCIIEWPEKGGDFIPPADIVLSLEKHGKGRLAQVQAKTRLGEEMSVKLGQIR